MKPNSSNFMKNKWVARGLVMLALAGLWLLYLRHAIGVGVSFSLNQDNEYFIGPVLSSISDSLTQGVWPLRMDTALGGLPLYNFPQLSPFYPFYFGWLNVFVGPLETARSMHWITLGHVLIIQINMYIFVRFLGASRLSAICGAVIFAFGANSLSYAGWINITAPYAWLPLYAAGIVGVLRDPKRPGYLFLAMLGMVLLSLASPAQPLIHAIFISVVFFVVYFFHQEFGIRWHNTRSALIRMVGVAVLALLILAPVIGPAVIEFRNSIRWIGPFPPVIGNARIPFAAFQIDQLSLSDLVGVIFRFKDPAVGSPFVGLIVLVLAVIGWACSPRTWLISALSFIAFYSLLSSAGSTLGLAYLNYVLPLMNKIREPSRFLVLFHFGIAALAALGIDRLRIMVARGDLRRLFICLVVSIVCSLALLSSAGSRTVSNLPLALPLIVLAGLGAGTWLIVRSRVRRGAEIVAIAWSVSALLLLGMDVRWVPAPTDHSMYATSGGAEREKVFDHLLQLDSRREYRVLFDGEIDKQIASMHASYRGIRTLNAYFNPAPYRQFQDLYYHGPRTKNYFQVFGAKYLVCKKCSTEALSGFFFLESVAGFDIYEAKSVQPYARVFDVAEDFYADENDFLEKISRRENAGDLLFVQDKLKGRVGIGEGVKGACENNIIHRSVTDIHLDVRCEPGGLLQINEYFDSAWQVDVDGRRVDVEKVNGYLMGVLVPPGSSSVRFIYRPATFYYFLPLGLLGFICAAWIFLRVKRGGDFFDKMEVVLQRPADKVAGFLERVGNNFLSRERNKMPVIRAVSDKKISKVISSKIFTYEEFKASEFFPSLDGLRAIAVVLVIIVHYAGEAGAFLTGWLGVQAFFVLSGFLITTLLLRENEAAGRVSIKSFYIRRAFRIMPIYFLVLAFVIWQSYRLGGESWMQIKTALPYYLTFFNEQSGPAPWKITWTLGVEWKFYLVWPALAFLVARTDRQRLLLGSVVLIGLFSSFGTSWLMSYHYSVLLMGGVLAIVMHDRRGFSLVRCLSYPPVAVMMGVAFVIFQTQVGKLVPHYGDAVVANIYGVAVVLLIPAILGSGWPAKLLSSKPFVFVGRRSYALYLVQIIASQAVTGYAPWRTAGWPEAFMVFITGLLIADVLLRFVEKPMIEFGRRFDSSRAKS